MTTPSLVTLGRAAHRPMFFVGVVNILLTMIWWVFWLSSVRWDVVQISQPEFYAGRVHAFLMQYLVFPSFFFGFLLTVFPRWSGEPDLDRHTAWPPAIGLIAGAILTIIGALGWHWLIVAGAVATLAGWVWGLIPLTGVAFRDKGKTWHVIGCYGGLCLGALGILMWLIYLLTGLELLADLSINIGTFGLLTPVYFTVVHRMLPFFTANVIAGYKPWRPKWVLLAAWILFALRIILPHAWLWPVDAALFILMLLVFVRWTPRKSMPPILLVLYLALAWLPIAFGLLAIQDLEFARHGFTALGKSPEHALFVGFFASMLVAMVTRVTQGHSGRPLVLPPVAAVTFGALQIVCIVRLASELTTDAVAWQTIAAAGWVVTFLPWILWAAWIYTTPRADGKPG